MTYRVRKQAITGKLVLQVNSGEGWGDVRGINPEAFAILTFHEADEMRCRIAKYEHRAEAQRIARANRAIDKSSGFQIANTGSGDF